MPDDQNQTSGPSDATVSSETETVTTVVEDQPRPERRLHGRFPVSAALEAVELQSKARFSGRISDMSMDGCYVDTITALPEGATLKIRLKHEGKFFESRAKVITSSAGMGMGLMFTETEPEQLAILQRWIRELNGEELPSEPELPEIESQDTGEPGSSTGRSDVLSELISELMRSGVLSDVKGRALLQKASRR